MINAMMQRDKEAKTENENKSPMWGCTYLFLFGVICSPIIFCALAIGLPRLERATFCNISHEIYQAISDGELLWIQNLNETDNPSFNIEVASGNKYIISVNMSDPAGTRRFLIPIERSRTDYHGAWGFIYDPSDVPYINALYHVEHLEGDVYCYWYA